MMLNATNIHEIEAKNHILLGSEMEEGEGVRVNRLFPVRSGQMNHDPFVLWDHFKFRSGAGFPEHPHRGFEGITYLFEGGIQHKDSEGNQSRLLSDGAQRFTAGKGIHHSEMPLPDMYTSGIQLWVNLPKQLKQIAPDYQQIDAEQIPERVEQGVRVRTIVKSHESVLLNTSVQYFDLKFERDTWYRPAVPSEHNGIVYVVEGDALIQGQKVIEGNAYLFSADSSESVNSEIQIFAQVGTRLMLATGEPHNEPIYQHGPFVD